MEQSSSDILMLGCFSSTKFWLPEIIFPSTSCSLHHSHLTLLLRYSEKQKTKMHLISFRKRFTHHSMALGSVCSSDGLRWPLTGLPGAISCLSLSIITLSIIGRGIRFLLADQVTALSMMLAAGALQSDGAALEQSTGVCVWRGNLRTEDHLQALSRL